MSVDRSHPVITAMILLVSALSILPAEEEQAIEIPPGVTVRTGFGVGAQNLGFDVAESGLSADDLSLTPNVPLHWIIGAAWKRVGLSLRIKLPATVADLETRGRTEFTNLQLQFFGDRNAVEVNAQQHTGMYIENEDDFDEEITDTRLDDLRLTTLSLAYFRALNPRHSLAAAYKLNAWNARSTGSTILLGSYSLIGIEVPGGPARSIPAAEGTIWSGDVVIFTQTATVGIGYGANLTWNNVFFAPLLAIGFGGQWGEYGIGPESGRSSSLAPSIYLRASAGINGPRWIAAIVGSFDRRSVQTPYLTAVQGSSLLEFVVGRRFPMRRWRGTRDLEY